MSEPMRAASGARAVGRTSTADDDRRSTRTRRLPAVRPPELQRLRLTRRQIAVLEAIAGGATNAETARSLGISALTVKKHLELMYAATGARNRAALVAMLHQRSRQAAGGARGSAPRELPLALTRFIGRADEIDEVASILSRHRLITLVGPGGIGKSRLAVEVARRAAPRFADGVHLVELAALADPRILAQTVSLGVGLTGARASWTSALVEHLRPRRVLVVLDNCEHLAPACASLADTVLRSCPDVAVLVTSRHVLGAGGELQWRVAGLSLPEMDPRSRKVMLSDAERSEAVQLFVDRAGLRLPGFRVRQQTAPAVVDLCRRLDGVPLAIELAAARVNVLSVEEILARLDGGLRDLRTDRPEVAPRQRSVRSVVEWSYRLLGREEAVLFERLSVFAGGCTLDAARSVYGGDGAEQADVLELLTHLVDRSLVNADTAAAETRYRTLETLRRYAAERLAQRPDAEAVRARHADYFRSLAEESDPQLRRREQLFWYDRLAAEHDNIRAALAWSLEHAPATALRIAGALWRFWYERGDGPEGLLWLERTLAKADRAASGDRAKALNAAGNLAHAIGDRERAEAFHRECLALRRQSGDRWGIAQSLENLGHRVLDRGDIDEARELCSEGLAIAHELGDAYLLGIHSAGMGTLALAGGDAATSREHYARALAFMRRSGDRDLSAQVLCCLADAERTLGRHRRAATLYRRSLIAFRALGDRLGVMDAVALIGALAAVEGDWVRGARLLAAASVAREVVGRRFWHIRLAFVDNAWAVIKTSLPERALESAVDQGRSLSLERSVESALGSRT